MRHTEKDVRSNKRLDKEESYGNSQNHFNSVDWKNRTTCLEISHASPASPSNWSNRELKLLEW